jgi:GT2 family glycosyltransferase
VNYNGENYIPKLFNSLKRQTFSDFEIVIIDNASIDKSLTTIHKNKETLVVTIVESKENLGFSKANNEGLRRCRGKYVVFLNNDTYVDSRWLEYMIMRIDKWKDVAALTCAIMHPFASGVQEGPANYDTYGGALGPAKGIFFYGTGASLMVRRDLLQTIGDFDSKLFMYQDDVDLCWRIRLCGYNIEFEPKAICYHIKKSAGLLKDNINMPVWIFYQAHCKNRIRILLKNYSVLTLLRKIPITLSLIFARSIFLSAINKKPQYITHYFKGIVWNLSILSDTISERKRIQKLRAKSDSSIQKYMLPSSIELKAFCELIRSS